MTYAFYAVAVALLAVIVTRRFAPAAAAVLGMVVALAIFAWGLAIFAQGGEMTFLGRPLGKPLFFGFVVVLFGFEALNLSLALKRRRQARDASASE